MMLTEQSAFGRRNCIEHRRFIEACPHRGLTAQSNSQVDGRESREL
jgi:hypothetical protein